MRLATLFAMILMLSTGALAARITVTSLDDNGAGSLRQAIADALPHQVIDFAVAGTITLGGDPLVVDAGRTMTLEGPGASILKIDANGLSRVLEIGEGASVTIRGVTIMGGGGPFLNGVGGGLLISGGAAVHLDGVAIVENQMPFLSEGGGIGVVGDGTILNMVGCVVARNHAVSGGGLAVRDGAELILRNTSVTENSAEQAGGITAWESAGVLTEGVVIADNLSASTGGGLSTYSTPLTMIDTSVIRNRAVGSPHNGFDQGAGGGLMIHGGAVLIERSRITHNQADGEGGGLHVAGGTSLRLCNAAVLSNRAGAGGGVSTSRLLAGVQMELENVTIASNIADGKGGVAEGGGLCVSQASAVLINCTVANNRAEHHTNGQGRGGGIHIGTAVVTLVHATVSGNYAGARGGGIHAESGLPVTLGGSLVARNSAPDEGPDLFGAFISAGHNLIGNGADSAGLANSIFHDLVGSHQSPIDPKFGEFGLWGGVSPTFPLLPGSPAIDAGDPASLVEADQRGAARDGSPDIGAFEWVPPLQVGLAPGSALKATAPKDFTVVLNPGEVLGEASIEIAGSGDFDITIVIVSPVNLPTGIVAPPAPPVGPGPFTLTWSGVAEAPPGAYLWRVNAHDTAGGVVQAFVVVTIEGDERVSVGFVGGGGGCALRPGSGQASAPVSSGAPALWLLLLLMFRAFRGRYDDHVEPCYDGVRAERSSQ